MGPIFLILVVVSIVFGALAGRLDVMSVGALDAAKGAVELAIKLIGAMALFLGLVEVLKDAGLMKALARALAPLFRRLFPEVPDGHPALGMITMNTAANVFGLGNAATPFGIEAIRQLDRLNGSRGTATDAMCLFLVINTSGVAVLPTGVIGVRAAEGSLDPGSIMISSLLATGFSTLIGVVTVFLLAKLPYYRATRPPLVVRETTEEGAPELALEHAEAPPLVPWRGAAAAALFAAAIGGVLWTVARSPDAASVSGVATGVGKQLVAVLILGMVLYGWSRGVAVYEVLVRGAKQGVQVAVMIIPYLVAILVAIRLFRDCGLFDVVVSLVGPLTEAVGLPAEALPMALIRPLSAQGAFGVMVEAMREYGPDSYIGYLVSTLNGSTETTFYTLAVYGGAIGMKRTRHLVPACLAADLAGFVGASFACRVIYG